MTFPVDGGDGRRARRWNRLSLIALTVGIVMLLSSAVLGVLLLGNTFDGNDFDGPGETVDTFGSIDDALTPQPTATAAPLAVAPPSDAPIERVLIPKFDVDAPVIILGLDENNVMESPDEPCDVAWYDFTSYPGAGSNAVFSGHVDWFNLGAAGCKCEDPNGCGGAGGAVFWNLKDMVLGDLVEVRLTDGTLYQYQVITKQQLSGSADFRPVVSSTEKEIVTLITCGGTFDFSRGHYNDRVIIQAERIVDAPGVAAPSASASP
ncbi:MAG: class F sortase [Chloroflexi bacterium]|nr:class F sortase [Chloroflexota bacterium]